MRIKLLILFAVLCFWLATTVWSYSFNINRVVGSNINENGPAIQEDMVPTGSYYDESTGTIYYTDGKYNRVRKILPDGTVVTIAGTGAEGYTGDNGPALDASFNEPSHVQYIPSTGEVYICDSGNYRIRKILANGNIITVAGGGQVLGPSGDGGPATNAFMYGPIHFFVTPSNEIYIAELYRNRIRKVFANGTITTFAGSTSQGFAGDGGPATSASLYYPKAVAVDSNGLVYIADTQNSRIRVVLNNGTIQTFVGSTYNTADGIPAKSAAVVVPTSLFITAQNDIYYAERHRVRVVNATTGLVWTIAGQYTRGSVDSGDGGLATAAELDGPISFLGSSSGDLFVVVTRTKIRKISSSGIISTVGGASRNPNVPLLSNLNNPVDVLSSGNYMYIIDQCNIKVVNLQLNNISIIGGSACGYEGDNGPANLAKFYTPKSMTMSPSGELYISDTYNHAIRKILTNGTIVTICGNSTAAFYGENIPATQAMLNYPYGILFYDNELYIADYFNHCVRKIKSDGNIVTVAGTCGFSGLTGDKGDATKAKLDRPQYMDIDKTTGIIYISVNSRIRKLYPNGMIDTAITFTGVNGLTVDAAGGVFISKNDHTVNRLVGNNVLATVAGKRPAGYSDNIQATSAWISVPAGIDVDNTGKVLFAESGNKVVRTFKVCLTGITSNGICNDCPAGQTPDATQENCVPCISGYASATTDSICKQCPAGTYSNGIACVSCASNEISMPGSTTCQQCPTDTFPNSFKIECVNCTVGYYLSSTTGQCVACNAGETSNPTATGCIPCGVNMYSPSSGSDCLACPSGQISNPTKTGCIQNGGGGSGGGEVISASTSNNSCILLLLLCFIITFVV